MSNGNNLGPGDMKIYDNNVPGLKAAKYEISVTQALPNTATDGFSKTITQKFVVQGPQFTIDTSEIHAAFPADNANGNYETVLPSIILEMAALPWERVISDDDSIPWVALLVLQGSEVELDPATNSPLITSSVEEFLKPATGIVKPNIELSSIAPQVRSSSMNSISISTDTFQAVTPRLWELSSLAQVLEVNPELQVVNGKEGDGWFSIVLGNRFPDSEGEDANTGATNYVHLVSLEGLTEYLVDNPQWPAGAKKVQLASLASWRFVSVAKPGQTFGDLAENLIKAAGSDPKKLLLRIPVKDDGSGAAARVLDGYTALSYHTAPGADTFAWYRGPLAPFPAQPLPAAIETYLHPSQAMIYDQPSAIFDNSYGAAWTMGRLMALADPVFIDAIQRVRQRMVNTSTRLLARSKMPHLAGITDLKQLASPGLTRKTFINRVQQGMGEALTRSFENAPAPEADGGEPGPKNFLFPDEQPPSSKSAEARWFMQKPSVREFLVEQVAQDINPLAEWLAKLALLYNVPFNHLVPDQRMLPAESVRFFFVDQNWLTVLVNGAMSIGVNTGRDREVHSMLAAPMMEQTLLKAPAVRKKLLRRTDEAPPLPLLPASGMLLRSALITGFPGLTVEATEKGNTVDIMRMDRLAPDVLLVLWAGVPDTVTVSQPQQGIVFGVGDGWVIPLRSLQSSNLGEQLGQNFPTDGKFTQYMRPAAPHTGGRVLNLLPKPPDQPGYLIPALSKALGQNTLSSSRFAIEMIQRPEQIKFNPPIARD